MNSRDTNGVVCSTCGVPQTQSSYALAYDRRKDTKTSRFKFFHVLLVSGDCIFIGMQPILVYMSKVDGKFPFNPISVNFMTEVCKISFAVIMVMYQARNRKQKDKTRFSFHSIWKAAKSNTLLAVPAFLYAINNYLKFIMQLYFKPLTVKMLGNLKVLTIALLLKLVMHRKFSILQWEALCLLLIGISINQVPCGPQTSDTFDAIAPMAWLCTFFAVTIPSTASVFNEYALKRQFDTSVHLQNLFMFTYGAMFNLLFLLALQAFQGGDNLNILKGHSRATFVLVVNNAMQGILSSFFFKYADTILKKYSSTVATIFTGLASAALFGHTLTVNFVLGVSVVLISMHQFFSNPARHPVQDSPLKRETSNGKIFSRGDSLLNMASGANEEANHLRPPSEREMLLPG